MYFNAERRETGSGGLTRVHRAHYLPTSVWSGLDARDRHLARILAVQAAARSNPVFSHLSSIVLHDLPSYSAIGGIVHVVTGLHGSGRKGAGVVRHRVPLDEREVQTVRGIRFTSAEDTIADLAHDGSSENALVFADAYLRRLFRNGRVVESDGMATWRAKAEAGMSALKGTRGARAAREVFALADPRKDSVLESISHLRLVRLGFEVELQVPVPGPNGQRYFVDFEFSGLELFGECDGKVKYLDERLLAGRTASEVVYEEKQRQDWICDSTGKRMLRWGYEDARSELRLSRKLAASRVRIPRPPVGFGL